VYSHHFLKQIIMIDKLKEISKEREQTTKELVDYLKDKLINQLNLE